MRTGRIGSLLFVVAAGLLGGCAVSPYSVGKANVKLGYTGAGSVAVATMDRRPYVLEGSTAPKTIGRMVSLWPESMRVWGAPTLADALTAALAKSLGEAGLEISRSRP